MGIEGLPEDVIDFIVDFIDSVEQLNVLFLLQTHSERSWTLDEITRELRSTETSIQRRLEALYSRNILVPSKDGKHRYTPCSMEVARTLSHLSDVYKTKPYRIIEAIYSKPDEVLKALADAFKLKKDK